MSTETIIKVGGITRTKELSISGGEGGYIGGGSSNIGGEDYIEGAGEGIARDVNPGL